MKRYNYVKKGPEYRTTEQQVAEVEKRRADIPRHAKNAHRFLSEVHTAIQYADTLRAEPLRGPVEEAMYELSQCVEEIEALRWEEAQEAGFP